MKRLVELNKQTCRRILLGDCAPTYYFNGVVAPARNYHRFEMKHILSCCAGPDMDGLAGVEPLVGANRRTSGLAWISGVFFFFFCLQVAIRGGS